MCLQEQVYTPRQAITYTFTKHAVLCLSSSLTDISVWVNRILNRKVQNNMSVFRVYLDIYISRKFFHIHGRLLSQQLWEADEAGAIISSLGERKQRPGNVR